MRRLDALMLWCFLGNIPPLVRLLQAFIEKASKVISETKKAQVIAELEQLNLPVVYVQQFCEK